VMRDNISAANWGISVQLRRNAMMMCFEKNCRNLKPSYEELIEPKILKLLPVTDICRQSKVVGNHAGSRKQ